QVIPYYPLSDDMLAKIVALQLNRIVKRLQANHGVSLQYSPEVLSLIVSRCTEVESGGRMIDAILTNTVLPKISHQLLTMSLDAERVSTITIDVEASDFVYQYA
ncbi:MAG: type VI secretion system ATPase TssH, partial [Neisseriaceae bacterium]|nr:type VI secretion system ATPase TssH [Neisseriaceae bacterium]